MTEPNTTIDLDDHLSSGKWSLFQKIAVVLCAVVIVLDGLDVLAISLAAPDIMADWGITKSDLAPAIAAGLFGMAGGALAGGFLGDRFGRRRLLIANALTFGTVTLCMMFADGVVSLSVLRFIAGLGLGSALPNATALAAEVTPKKHRPMAITLTITCIPVGGLLAGEIGALVLPDHGWQGMFFTAGVLPILVALILILLLPESPGFLMKRSDRGERLKKMLAKLGHPVPEGVAITRSEDESGQGKDSGSPTNILHRSYARDTMLLWVGFFFSLTATYLLFNWMPTLLSELGHDRVISSRGMSFLNIGGIASALLAGPLFGLLGSRKLLIFFALGAFAIIGAVLANPAILSNPDYLFNFAFIILGGCILGFQNIVYPLAANVYPASIRASGVGSAAGIGRLGAVVSANVGAILLASGGAPTYFGAVALCMLIAVIGALLVTRQIRAT